MQPNEITLPVLELKPGMLIVKFLDVPLRFHTIDSWGMAFLRKFIFIKLKIHRGGQELMLDADELLLGDHLLDMGLLSDPVRVNHEKNIQTLSKTGFGQVIVIPGEKTVKAEAAPLAEPEPAAGKKEGTRAHEAQVGHLHALQDRLDWNAEVAQKGEKILADLYSVNRFDRGHLKGLIELGDEMAQLVEVNPHAGNARILLEEQDAVTHYHSVEVAQCVVSTSKMSLGYGGKNLATVAIGALMHDIGKSKLPAYLTQKEGQFTDQERETMHQHPLYGAKILRHYGFSNLHIDMARHHHVTRTGGYPQVPFEKVGQMARLTAIADIYQGMTATRGYKSEEIPYKAMQTLLKLAKNQTDLGLTLAFIKSMGVYPIGSTLALEDGRVCFVVGFGSNSARPQVVPVLTGERHQIFHHELIDLSSPINQGLHVNRAVPRKEYLPKNAFDLFKNLEV